MLRAVLTSPDSIFFSHQTVVGFPFGRGGVMFLFYGDYLGEFFGLPELQRGWH